MTINEKVDFNDYWQVLDDYARKENGLKKGEWMQLSGISYKRYSEFSQGKRAISSGYFIKLCGGLSLAHDDVEAMSKKEFTQKQRDSLKFEVFVKSNRKWLELLMNNPKMMEQVKKLVSSK